MKKLLLITTFNFALLTFNCFAQNRTIDSLHTLLKTDKQACPEPCRGDTNTVNHLNKLSLEYMSIGLYDTAICIGNTAFKLAQQLLEGSNSTELPGIKKSIANSCNNIGNACFYQGNYPKTFEYWLKALKIDEELKDKNGIAKRLGNIGVVYMKQADYPKALVYCFRALKMMEELNMKKGMANVLGNIGIIYKNQADYPKALAYYLKAFKIDEEIGNKNGSAADLSNIGAVYNHQKEYAKALDYYFKALKIAEIVEDKNAIASILGNIGSVYTTIGKFKEAEQYLKKSIIMDEVIDAMDGLRQDEETLSELYDTLGRYKEAFIHYKKAMALKDTIFSQENKNQLIRKEMNYEFDKKEAATKAEHDKERALAEAEKKKQQFILVLVSCFLLLVFLFAGFVFRSLRITRKQKNIIELQKNEVSQQKEIVEKQKEKIIDSITYAQRIQQSILMEESEIQNILPECFIYYQPKDIVSGDFYWCSQIDDKIILAAVDCTGHGVPGAFMSMIGNTLLNQIVNEKHITTPSEILRLLNLGVYEALHQQKDATLSEDGMDIALCSIGYKNNEIQYAGAQNPLFVLANGQIEVIKADIHEIGGGGMIAKIQDPIKKEFTNHIIPLKKGACIYLFSDGYMDQFGGSDRKKFGTQKFKELLLDSQHLDMQKQKEIISSAHAEWKGNTAQIDDMLVIGIRI